MRGSLQKSPCTITQRGNPERVGEEQRTTGYAASANPQLPDRHPVTAGQPGTTYPAPSSKPTPSHRSGCPISTSGAAAIPNLTGAQHRAAHQQQPTQPRQQVALWSSTTLSPSEPGCRPPNNTPGAIKSIPEHLLCNGYKYLYYTSARTLHNMTYIRLRWNKMRSYLGCLVRGGGKAPQHAELPQPQRAWEAAGQEHEASAEPLLPAGICSTEPLPPPPIYLHSRS